MPSASSFSTRSFCGTAADQKLWLLSLFEELATAARCANPAILAVQLLVLHEGALATQPLPFDSLSRSIDLARNCFHADVVEGRSREPSAR